MHYRQMKQRQEETYMRLRDAGYEFCQNEDNGDVIVGKYDRTAETSWMIYAVAIHEDGRYTELDLSNAADEQRRGKDSNHENTRH